MITALILTDDGIEPLAATLAALVPAVAAGLVADAVVLDLDAAGEIAAVAEGVGAAHVRIAERRLAFAAGAAVARRDWLFCLEAGDVPQEVDWRRRGVPGRRFRARPRARPPRRRACGPGGPPVGAAFFRGPRPPPAPPPPPRPSSSPPRPGR